MTTNQKTGCAARLYQLFGVSPKPARPTVSDIEADREEEVLPYRLRDDFLSPAELNFYRVLQQAVAGSAVICLKVALGDLFYPKTGHRSENQIYRNKIDRKHVDFLLCDPGSLRPLVGIELDDASHQQSSRQERDYFVEQVFAAAELPLLRQPVRVSYNTRELITNLRDLTGLELQSPAQPTTIAEPSAVQTIVPAKKVQAFEHTAAAVSFSDGEVPRCPKCGEPMVLRTVKKAGTHYGNQFWGCRAYPRCRGVREY
ncbi:MAG: DUF2726 domain-containing protein [Chloroflexota bacterium]